jgi:hypothetical protein
MRHLLAHGSRTVGPSRARARGNLYSLIETAKANGLDPYAYLSRVSLKTLPIGKHDVSIQATNDRKPRNHYKKRTN